MEKTKQAVVLALLGFVIMLAGFVGFVSEPVIIYEIVFIAGLVIMVGAYILMNVYNRKLLKQVDELNEEEERDGFIYFVVDEPADDLPEIIDLTRK